MTNKGANYGTIAPINPEGLDDIAEALLNDTYQPIQTQNIITLDNLQIEEKSPREGNNKKPFYYDKSLQDLRSRGYQRHLRPDEALEY